MEAAETCATSKTKSIGLNRQRLETERLTKLHNEEAIFDMSTQTDIEELRQQQQQQRQMSQLHKAQQQAKSFMLSWKHEKARHIVTQMELDGLKMEFENKEEHAKKSHITNQKESEDKERCEETQLITNPKKFERLEQNLQRDQQQHEWVKSLWIYEKECHNVTRLERNALEKQLKDIEKKCYTTCRLEIDGLKKELETQEVCHIITQLERDSLKQQLKNQEECYIVGLCTSLGKMEDFNRSKHRGPQDYSVGQNNLINYRRFEVHRGNWEADRHALYADNPIGFLMPNRCDLFRKVYGVKYDDRLLGTVLPSMINIRETLTLCQFFKYTTAYGERLDFERLWTDAWTLAWEKYNRNTTEDSLARDLDSDPDLSQIHFQMYAIMEKVERKFMITQKH